jgi:hypothetical protein
MPSPGHVQRDGAKTQPLITHLFQPRALHHAAKCFGIGKHRRRGRKVGVRIAVTAQQSAQTRQYAAGNSVEGSSQERPSERRRLETNEDTSRTEDPRHLGQSTVVIWHIPQTKSDCDSIERFIRKRKSESIALDPEDPGL